MYFRCKNIQLVVYNQDGGLRGYKLMFVREVWRTLGLRFIHII